jgi:hypothetical protein
MHVESMIFFFGAYFGVLSMLRVLCFVWCLCDFFFCPCFFPRVFCVVCALSRFRAVCFLCVLVSLCVGKYGCVFE